MSGVWIAEFIWPENERPPAEAQELRDAYHTNAPVMRNGTSCRVAGMEHALEPHRTVTRFTLEPYYDGAPHHNED